MPNDLTGITALEWLTEMESTLVELETISWIAYDNSVLDATHQSASRYLVYAKAHERLRTVQTAIIEILKGRIKVGPPTDQDIERSARLLDRLQKDIQEIGKVSANLKLFSDLFDIINQRFV